MGARRSSQILARTPPVERIILPRRASPHSGEEEKEKKGLLSVVVVFVVVVVYPSPPVDLQFPRCRYSRLIIVAAIPLFAAHAYIYVYMYGLYTHRRKRRIRSGVRDLVPSLGGKIPHDVIRGRLMGWL